MSSPGFGALPEYAELQGASNFSFLHGASHADALTAQAAQLGYAVIAITDEYSLAGVVHAHVEANKAGFLFIAGSEFVVTKGQLSVGRARPRLPRAAGQSLLQTLVDVHKFL